MADVIQVQRPDIGRDNDPEWPTVSYGGNPPRRRTDGGRVALPWQALALLLAFLLLVGGFGYWRYDTYCSAYQNPCWWHAPALTTTLVLGSVAGLLGWLYTRIQVWQAQADAERNEARVLPFVKNRYGDSEPVHVFENRDALQLIVSRYLAATQLEQAIAPYKRYSGVETLNEGAKTELNTNLGAPPALPAPVEAGPGPMDRLWARLRDATHIGLFGMSTHGKTTLARAILHDCVARGELVCGISLAADRVDWPIPMIGAGGEATIVQALDALRAELKRREDAGERDAQPIRVFVDELTSATADKAVYEAWQQIMRSFMTRSRHVGMYLVVMAHDNTSGIFASVGAARLIRNFMQVWCVKENGRYIVRVDDGITLNAEGRQERQIWQVEDTADILARSQRGGAIPPSTVFLTEDDLTPATPKPTRQQAQEKAIRGAIARGWSRDRARLSGLSFDNNLWTRLGGK